jgi:uncharacterized protein (DUF427 family)
MRAIWKGTTIAESDDAIKLEGYYYFPQSSVKMEYLRESSYRTFCPWKGTASFYSVEVNGETNKDSAWHYPTPSERGAIVKDRIAFWKGIIVLP